MEKFPQIKNLTLQEFTSVLGNLSLGVQDEFRSKICKKICDKLWVVETRGKPESLYFKAESKHELIRKISVSNEFREFVSFWNRHDEREVNTVVFKGPPTMFVCVVCGVDPKGKFKHSHNINKLNNDNWLEIVKDLYGNTDEYIIFKKVELSEEMLHGV